MDLDEHLEAEAEYSRLQRELRDLDRNLKEVNGKLAEVKIQVVECQSEIDVLHEHQGSCRNKYKEQVTNLQKAIEEEEQRHLKNMDLLNADLSTKTQLVSSLEEELEGLKHVESSPTKIQADESEQLYTEQLMLSETFNKLLSQVQALQLAYEEANLLKEQLEKEEKELLNVYETKKEDTYEKSAQIDALQEELLAVKLSLAPYKNDISQQQSNCASLFGEIDDKRVHLQETYNTMKIKFMEINRDHGKKQKLISQLQNQISLLGSLRSTNIQKMEENKRQLKNTFKSRLELLKEIVQIQKNIIMNMDFTTDDHPSTVTKLLQNITKELDHYSKFLEKKVSDWTFIEDMCSFSLAETEIAIEKLKTTIGVMEHQLEESESAECLLKDSTYGESSKENSDANTSQSKPPAIRSCLKSSEQRKGKQVLAETNANVDDNVTLGGIKEEPEFCEEFNGVTVRKGINMDSVDVKSLNSKLPERNVKFASDTAAEGPSTFRPKGRKVYIFPKKTS